MTLIFREKPRFLASVFAILAIFSLSPLYAEGQHGQITVVGNGQVSVAPDQAVVRLGARNRAKTAQDAMQKTATATQAILTQLTKAGLEIKDIQTSALSLQPLWGEQSYKSQKADETPEPIGFEASNSVQAIVRDLDTLGGLLDAIVAQGGNNFSGFQFGVQQPQPHQDSARALAVKDAMRKADLYAKAAERELGAVMVISETLNGPVHDAPMYEMAMARSAKTPIAAGQLDISAQIKMVFELK